MTNLSLEEEFISFLWSLCSYLQWNLIIRVQNSTLKNAKIVFYSFWTH